MSSTEHVVSARNLDHRGRCCGRKPIKYKRDGGPHYFCPRCNRSYDLVTQRQIPNWCYEATVDPKEFRVKHPHMAERAKAWR